MDDSHAPLSYGDDYYALKLKRDSHARLCASSLLKDDIEWAMKHALLFKEADDALEPWYEAARGSTQAPE